MTKMIRAFSLFTIFFLLYGCSSSGNTYMEKRAAIDKMSADAVSKLSEKNATASREIKNGYGYAVFSNSNVTVLFVGGSGGYGVLHNNQNGENTYMKMGGANVGYSGSKSNSTESIKSLSVGGKTFQMKSETRLFVLKKKN